MAPTKTTASPLDVWIALYSSECHYTEEVLKEISIHNEIHRRN